MPTAETIARHLLYLALQSEEPMPITHLQLQKLLYYAEGWSLVHLGRSLFDDRIEAWIHGPVVPRVYPRFADHDGHGIPAAEALEDSSLSGDQRRLVGWVWARYSRYSPSYLRELTHGEPPWTQARKGLPLSAPSSASIDRTVMETFFRASDVEETERLGLDRDELLESLRQARSGQTVPLELT